MKKAILILVPTVLVIIGVFIFLRSGAKSIQVEAGSFDKRIVTRTVSASGEVTSNFLYDLSFEGAGRINQLNVKKSDAVTQGMLLASAVSASDFNDIQSLRDTLDIAKRDKDVYVELYGTNKDAVGGDNEYEVNVRRFDEYISRAQANYNSALNSLAKLRIISPIDGTVIDVIKEQNEVAATGQTVIRVADLSDLVFKVLVDQEDFGLISVGDQVELTLDSHKDTIIKGTVSALPLFALESGDFEVDIAVVASQNTILLGMKGDATIKIDETPTEVNALSFDLLNEDDNGFFIWIDEQGLLKKKRVKIGLEGDFYTEVKTQLDDLNIVIPAQNSKPIEGLRVKYAKSN